jgi:hypothetical protein
MPIDKLDLSGRSNVKASYLMASNILLGISVLSFVLMLGGCVSCFSSIETTYDSQETYYTKTDGTAGKAAKSHTKGGDPTVFVVSAGVCVISFIVGGLVRGFGEEDTVAE